MRRWHAVLQATSGSSSAAPSCPHLTREGTGRRFGLSSRRSAARRPAPRTAWRPLWVAGSVDLCAARIVYATTRRRLRRHTGQSNTTDRTAGAAAERRATRLPDGQDFQTRPRDPADACASVLPQLRVTASTKALYQADSTVLAVAIDIDANQATVGGKCGRAELSTRLGPSRRFSRARAIRRRTDHRDDAAAYGDHCRCAAVSESRPRGRS